MRPCLDCGGDISMRGPRAKRCSECAHREAIARATAWTRAHGPRRTVRPDPITSSVPVLQPIDMTPARVIEVDGEAFEVVFGGGEGLSSAGGRGSSLVEGRGVVRRNGAPVMGGM